MSLIFDIKPYAINDGPGIRLTIFFKGCPLSCKWCHNPESISPKKQKLYTKSKCIGAQSCIEICPNNALTLSRDGIVTDIEKCELCGKCAEVCPTKAIEMSGSEYTIDFLLNRIEKERPFFESSGGGITLSGGEPLMHCEFAIPLLKELGKRNIHRTIDTTAFASEKVFKLFMENAELFLIDFKHPDSEKHRFFTGQSNEIIIQNIKLLSEAGKDFIIRIPFIKGVNNSIEDITKSAEFLSSLPKKPLEINVLEYHDIGKMKHEKLGSNYDYSTMQTPDNQDKQNISKIFKQYGLEIVFGG